MSRYPGGIIRKTPVTPAGPLQNGAAPGMWTLAEASYWVKQGLWPTQGNILAVEDVFSTYLYTGNGSTQTITTGIDLAGKGGMLWIKNRSAATNNIISDTVRGAGNFLMSNASSQQFFNTDNVSALSSTGFSVGVDSNTNGTPGDLYVSWTFREAPNFFDVVTYTGNGAFDHMIPHSLGVPPGCVIIKPVSASGDWIFSSRETASTYNYGLFLNTTGTRAGTWDPVGTGDFNSTTFDTYIGNSAGVTNTNGVQYVAYLFAHVPGSDGIIQCGSYTGTGGAGNTINLGWEPQWLLIKSATESGSFWQTFDNMRGIVTGGNDPVLFPNATNAEGTGDRVDLTATGFLMPSATLNASGQTYIYVAIRRGPMRTPTLGTSVFSPIARTGTGAAATVNVGFAPDFATSTSRAGFEIMPVVDKLRGPSNWLRWKSQMTNAESSIYSGQWFTSFTNTGVTLGADNSGGVSVNSNGTSLIQYYFQRAPGFMDVVCYTGTGSATTFNHNLGVAPELMIVKRRNNVRNWAVYVSSVGANKFLKLNLPNTPETDTSVWNNTAPTSTVFSVGTSADGNGSGDTYVAYLFASAPGVSKVGSYTGNGSSQTINCAFTTGARFVLIKRTDSTGDWYVWDSARGIVAGNDPYLALNSTAAEVTSNDSVDTDNTGFVVNQVAASNINVNAATYIFLAIA